MIPAFDMRAMGPLVMLHMSSASITLFADQQNAAILPFLQHYDEAVVMPNRGNKYFYLARYALKYRPRKFDLVVISKGSPSRMLNLFAYLLSAGQRVAYVDDNWHGRLMNAGQLFDPKVPGTRHHALELLQLLDPSIDSVPPSLYPRFSIPAVKKDASVSSLLVSS